MQKKTHKKFLLQTGSKNPYSATKGLAQRFWRKCEKWVDYLQRKCDNMIVITERNREDKICLNGKYIMRY